MFSGLSDLKKEMQQTMSDAKPARKNKKAENMIARKNK